MFKTQPLGRSKSPSLNKTIEDNLVDPPKHNINERIIVESGDAKEASPQNIPKTRTLGTTPIAQKQTADPPKEKAFVFEQPKNKNVPALTQSKPQFRVIGKIALHYVPLSNNSPALPPVNGTLFGEQKEDGIHAFAEFSKTNFVKRIALINGYTFEGVVTCDFRPVPNVRQATHPLVHLEPVKFEKLQKACDNDLKSIEGQYRPLSVPDANNRMGPVTYTLVMVGDELRVERVDLVLKQTMLISWAQALNDHTITEQGGFPLIEMANMSIARHPPGSPHAQQQQQLAQQQQQRQQQQSLSPSALKTASRLGTSKPVPGTQPPQLPNVSQSMRGPQPTPMQLEEVKAAQRAALRKSAESPQKNEALERRSATPADMQRQIDQIKQQL